MPSGDRALLDFGLPNGRFLPILQGIATLATPYRDYRNHHFYEKLGYTKVEEFAVTEAGLDPNFVLFKYEKAIEG